MTTLTENTEFDRQTRGPSLLPFDEKDLLALRVLPAEFSRMAGVSKQTVSRWIKENKITLGADGRLDPNVAMRQLLKNGDPGRIRARLIRQAYSDMSNLRNQSAKVEEVEEQLAEANRRIQYLDGFIEEIGLANELVIDILVDAVEKIREQPDRESLRRLFADLMDAASIKAGEALGIIDAEPLFQALEDAGN